MTMLEQIESIWQAIEKESGDLPGTYQRRVPESGALTCHASVLRPEGQRRISVQVIASVCSQLSLPSGSKGFSLTVEHRPHDALAVLHLDERTGAGRAIFSMVSADLISVSKSAVDAPSASMLLCNRLVAWKRFFEAQGDQGISREEYVGLWGELSVMDAMLSAGTPASEALLAWQGPMGAAQDFSFGSRAIEVKTGAASEVAVMHISNPLQLDESLFDQLRGFIRRRHVISIWAHPPT